MTLTNANMEALAAPMRSAQRSGAAMPGVCESMATKTQKALEGGVDALYMNGYLNCMYGRGVERTRRNGLFRVGLASQWEQSDQCSEDDVCLFVCETVRDTVI